MSGCPGDIPANAITWKVITMPEENLPCLKTLWNIWGLNPAGSSFHGSPLQNPRNLWKWSTQVTDEIKALGPNKNFVKTEAKVA